jgi:hypothetical protein
MRVRITRIDHDVNGAKLETSAACDRSACGGSAHLQLEPRLRGVTDSADGDTDHSPHDMTAQQRELSAGLRIDGRLGLAAENSIHAIRLKVQRSNRPDRHSARRISLRNNRYR